MIDIKAMFDENEKPLDTLVTDGGFAGVFRKVGCIGDSLSSGEFEGLDEQNVRSWHDMFDFSWGQYLARFAGLTAYNFSRGGMSAWEYIESFADLNHYFEKGIECQAFIIALGVNDMTHVLEGRYEFGDYTDIDTENCRRNKKTFIGYYARIIQTIMEKQPHAHFFLMTCPRDGSAPDRAALYDRHAAFLYHLAEIFPRTWVMDFRRYAPEYDAFFKEKFYMSGHLNPAGYLLTGKMVASYLDYIVRHNMDYFAQIGFIGSPLYNKDYKK